MQQEKERFLNLKNPSARLNAEETAWLLGFSSHEIPILVANGLLKPLGHPPANGPKYFATGIVQELQQDFKWLAKASDAIVEYWRTKNGRKSINREDPRGRHRPDLESVESHFVNGNH